MSRNIPMHGFRGARGWTVLATLLFSVAPHGEAASLTITALQRDGKPLAGAVITVEATAPTLPPVAPVTAIMDQIDLEFVPDVLVVPLNSTVQFPNSDSIGHQVYSFSDARQFQLPQYRGKPYPPVEFSRPGVVTLGCNIHDNMLAYIVVTAAQFFGRTDPNGEWFAPELPAGQYRVRAWHPLLNEPGALESVIVVGDGAAAARLHLARGLKPAPITGRPRSWDY